MVNRTLSTVWRPTHVWTLIYQLPTIWRLWCLRHFQRFRSWPRYHRQSSSFQRHFQKFRSRPRYHWQSSSFQIHFQQLKCFKCQPRCDRRSSSCQRHFQQFRIWPSCQTLGVDHDCRNCNSFIKATAEKKINSCSVTLEHLDWIWSLKEAAVVQVAKFHWSVTSYKCGVEDTNECWNYYGKAMSMKIARALELQWLWFDLANWRHKHMKNLWK